MYWEIHPPRTERFPEDRGVQNSRPRDISRSEGDVFPNASWLEAVCSHSLHQHNITGALPMFPSRWYLPKGVYTSRNTVPWAIFPPIKINTSLRKIREWGISGFDGSCVDGPCVGGRRGLTDLVRRAPLDGSCVEGIHWRDVGEQNFTLPTCRRPLTAQLTARTSSWL